MENTLPRTPSTPPKARRRARSRGLQALAVLCSVAIGSVLLYPDARADDLNNKKHKVQQGIKGAQADLEESSKSLYNATIRLRAARTELGLAQRTLARTEGQLTVARVVDGQMQARLAAATQALTTAQTELATGIANSKEQRAAIGRLAAANFLNGDPRLLTLSMIAKAQNPEDLATEFNTVGNLMDRQTSTYDRYRATEALLKVTAQKVAAAKAAVAVQRQAAAVNLAHRQSLERSAVSNRARVVTLVAARRSLAIQAATARAADQRKLRKMKREEERIVRLILERAKHRKGGYKGANSGVLLQPVANSYITSPYGWRRHPIFGYWGLHDGDDFHAPCGTPELASASGTVISEYYSDVWGNRLFLDVGKVNGKEMTLIYNHISSYKVGTGAKVGRGDTVALAGTTGWSTACHLHFTVMLDGTAVDPVQFF